MKDYDQFDALGLAQLVRDKQVSPEELLEAAITRVEHANPAINAVVNRLYDHARNALRQGVPDGPFKGVPYLLKDLNALYKGAVTSNASRFFASNLADHDTEVVARLKRGGLCIFGKTNTPEFGLTVTSEPALFGPTRNPWDLERIPGGSGGGSSASLAAYEAPLAIGTDTGGSIRQPGAVTGTVGSKPTYGGTSRYGLVAFSSSLDTPGPCARNVEDAALLHAVIAGHDPGDSTSIPAPVPPVVEAARRGATGDLSGVRIGLVREFAGEGAEPGVMAAVREGIEALVKLGAEVVEVSCPHFEYALPAYYLIAPSEASSNLARFDGVRYGLRVGDDGRHSLEEVMSLTREAGFGPEVKRRIILGTFALSSGYYDAYYGQAQKVHTLITRDFAAAFEQADVLVAPTTPFVAFPFGSRTGDPYQMYLADLFTIPSNLYGGPAISVPCGLSEGLPVGLQVMAPTMADDRMYRVAAALETVVPPPVPPELS